MRFIDPMASVKTIFNSKCLNAKRKRQRDNTSIFLNKMWLHFYKQIQEIVHYMDNITAVKTNILLNLELSDIF